MRRIPIIMLAAVLALVGFSPLSQATPTTPGKLKVRVLVITMFSGETAPWLARESLPVEIGSVRCSFGGLCVTTIGQGKSNAATSMMAILDNDRLDFRDAYFLTAGIAGTPPRAGTLGFAA